MKLNPLKYIWSLLFRLFPCPVETGLFQVGSPGKNSPVLLTCNFYLTVRRLQKHLRGTDVWLLVADSKGINVWCAAGAEEFNTKAVISALKTSEIGQHVAHRTVLLPPLGGPGVSSRAVKAKTGWTVHWGPVYTHDVKTYLNSEGKRSESMKRARYHIMERLDTALGSLFPFFLIGLFGFVLFAPGLAMVYTLAAIITFLFFFAICPWLPGKRGLTKIILPEIVFLCLLNPPPFWDLPLLIGPGLQIYIMMTMVLLVMFSLELGGLASNMPSDLDPFLARLGVGAIGNTAFAGTIRTELLNGFRVLSYSRKKCIGCRDCNEICPLAVWGFDEQINRAILAFPEKCTACQACLLQCPTGAIQARKISSGTIVEERNISQPQQC